jgi:hypothetical protein
VIPPPLQKNIAAVVILRHGMPERVTFALDGEAHLVEAALTCDGWH